MLFAFLSDFLGIKARLRIAMCRGWWSSCSQQQGLSGKTLKWGHLRSVLEPTELSPCLAPSLSGPGLSTSLAGFTADGKFAFPLL